MVTTLKRIDAREFEKLADMTALGANAREMARLVLVEGKTLTEAAVLCEAKSKQRVALAVGAIRRVHQANSTRSGWVKMDVDMPERLSTPLSGFLTALNTSRSRSAKSAAVSQVEEVLQGATQLLVAAPDAD